MGFSRVNLNAEIRVFGNSNQYKDFELDSNHISQHIQHKGKCVLVYAYQNFH